MRRRARRRRHPSGRLVSDRADQQAVGGVDIPLIDEERV